MWQSGLNVKQVHDGRDKRYCARLLQFTLQAWSGREAARAGAGQVAAIEAGRGFYADRVAEVGARTMLAGVAAGADEPLDGGHKRDEQ